MRNKIYMVLISAFIVSGCNSEDVQNNIDEIRGKDTKEPISTISKESDEQLGLEAHNKVRAEVFAGLPLSWSDEIAVEAQNYANVLAQNGLFEHEDYDKYGENLYASKNPTGEVITYAEAVQKWEVERQFYNYDNNDCSVSRDNTVVVDNLPYDTCGHYTQIVWKSTSYIGCGKAQYKTGNLKDGYVIVCKYSTPGNYQGQKPY